MRVTHDEAKKPNTKVSTKSSFFFVLKLILEIKRVFFFLFFQFSSGSGPFERLKHDPIKVKMGP